MRGGGRKGRCRCDGGRRGAKRTSLPRGLEVHVRLLSRDEKLRGDTYTTSINTRFGKQTLSDL